MTGEGDGNNIEARVAAVAVGAFLIFGNVSQAKHPDGCLPPYGAYQHIVEILTSQTNNESLHGLLQQRKAIVIEIWTGPPKKPSWTIVIRSLKTGCARIITIGNKYYFDLSGPVEGLPL